MGQVIGLGALVVGLAACASGDGGGAAAGGGDGGEGGSIGVSMPTQSSERWIFDGDNLVNEFEEAGYETTLQFAEDDVNTQVNQIQNMVAQGVDALVISAINNESLTGVLAEAKNEDVTVIAYDRLIRETEHVDYYATFDNYQVGVLQGQYIVDALDLEDEEGPFSIELFAGSLDDNNTAFFFDGAWDTLKPYIDEGKLEVGSGQTELGQIATERWSGDAAQDRMDNLLSTHYTGREQVDAVLSPYDGISRGIISSLESAGYSKDELPVVTGQDAEVASVQYIENGRQSMTVFKDTRELATAAVEMTVAAMNGEEPEVNDTETYDNGVKVVPSQLLEPVSVDAENYEEVLIESGYIDEADLR